MTNHSTQTRCHGRRKIDVTAPGIAAFAIKTRGRWLLLITAVWLGDEEPVYIVGDGYERRCCFGAGWWRWSER